MPAQRPVLQLSLFRWHTPPASMSPQERKKAVDNLMGTFTSSLSPPSKKLWWTDVTLSPGEKCKCGITKGTFGKWSISLWICDDLHRGDLGVILLCFLAVGVRAVLCSHWSLEAGGLASGRHAHNLQQSSSHRLIFPVSWSSLASVCRYDHFAFEFPSRAKCLNRRDHFETVSTNKSKFVFDVLSLTVFKSNQLSEQWDININKDRKYNCDLKRVQVCWGWDSWSEGTFYLKICWTKKTYSWWYLVEAPGPFKGKSSRVKRPWPRQTIKELMAAWWIF